MKVGTRSVLYGYHCIFLHWFFVAWGWFSLNGFRRVRIGTVSKLKSPSWVDDQVPITRIERAVFTSLLDYKLWLAFLLHDIGYWGKPNMDGPEGESHPRVAAVWMARYGKVWHDFCLYHSRFYAKRDGAPVSPLCYADKVAFLKYPTWLLVALCSMTGETEEYLRNYARDNPGSPPYRDLWSWAEGVKEWVAKWVNQHKDGSEDTVTQTRVH
jgi:hypothetical protein